MALIFSYVLLGDEAVPSWSSDLDISIQFSQTSFDNWEAGGDNAWSWQTNLVGNATYSSIHTWKNSIKLAFGNSKTGEQSARKSIDELRLESVYRWNKGSTFSPYVSALIQTQIAEGRDFTQEDEPTVSFAFDPTFITESVGVSYKMFPGLDTRAGLAFKQTLVSKSSITDADSEVGGEVVTNFSYIIVPKTTVSSTLQLFTDFSAFEDIDVYWDSTLKSRITPSISWNFTYNLIYDTDSSIRRQTRSHIGLSVSYELI